MIIVGLLFWNNFIIINEHMHTIPCFYFLGLKGNPLQPDIQSMAEIHGTGKLLQHMIDNMRCKFSFDPCSMWALLSRTIPPYC